MAQWSNAVAIPNQTTKAGPALAYLNGQLHMLHLGKTSNNIWHSVLDGRGWRPNVQTGLTSPTPPAFAAPPSAPGTAESGLLIYQSSEDAPDGVRKYLFSLHGAQSAPWPSDGPLPGNFISRGSAALTVDNRGHWLMVGLSTENRRMYFVRYRTLFALPTKLELLEHGVIPNQTTKAVPALANHHGRIHLLHLGGSSNDIWHSVDFGPNVRVPNQTSKGTPAMASYKGVLHMVHLGNSSENLWHSTLGERGWTPNVRIPGQSSSAAPALFATPDGLHLVYKGADSSRIWHSIYR